MNTLEQIKEHIDRYNYSASSVAKAIGVSQTTFSQYMNGLYPGNVGKIEELIIKFLERDSEKQRNPKKVLHFCKISNAKKVFEVLKMAHLDGEIAVITGDAGLGKTTAIREYSKINKDVILVEANLSYSTKTLIQEIHKKVGGDASGSINSLMNDVCNRLKDSGRMLIVDEGEHLPTRALDLLRTINDQTGCGVAVTGLPRLLHNLKGRKGEHAYLYSRVGLVLKLTEIEAEDVKMIVKSYFPDANGLCEDFEKFCNGNARRLSKLLLRTQRLSEVNEGKLTHRMVQVAKDLIIN